MTEVIDAAERAAATDPARSFIVQAPAGSGKTSLLAQRYLRLLAVVEEPEEILAITFTRKAAGEIRERIVDALAAAHGPDADDGVSADTRALARRVRARDEARGWGLARHPTRLRVQTIDAFNAALTRQLPLLCGLGAPPAITDDSQALHVEAARRTLAELDSNEPAAAAIAELLLHLDNRSTRVEELLAAMLARRDQWMPHLLVTGGADRQALEAAIRREVEARLAELRALFPADVAGRLAALASFAGHRLAEHGRDAPPLACQGLTALPAAAAGALAQWRGLADLLLTKAGGWRRSVNVANGFPPDWTQEKAAMNALLQELTGNAELAAALHQVRDLPAGGYRDEQWQVLRALETLLPRAVAQLTLVFAERGEVDHTEIALRALQALGEEGVPSDLALALDYRIAHILVDEFQDTSTSQYRLLEALTRGWTPGDGRSLFLVGDPMQSIYRFREAEVGLFLHARRAGLGDVPLEALRLRVNFRSRQPLVDWVNGGFAALLAPAEDAAAGAVPFEPAESFHRGSDGGVGIHPAIGLAVDPVDEAERVAAVAAERLAETADGTVTILVRARTQAVEILPALRRAGLGCQAVEIEGLAERPVVQDLLALARALAHDGDRPAWLAVLRAPWCGLELADLYHLAGDDFDAVLPERIVDPAWLAGLSAAGRARVERIAPVLAGARAQARRRGLRERVEATWLGLGGPATVADAAALDDAEAFLDQLEVTESAADIDDVNAIDAALAGLYARPDPTASARLQVMTVHKAKGLEFDTVILPGLHQRGRGDDDPLLLWMERPRAGGASDLLLAPMRPAGSQERDPIYDFIRQLAKEKAGHEQGRLLYVAVTRAVRRLELFGFVGVKTPDDGDAELAAPAAGSPLARLWPLVGDAFRAAFDHWQPSAEPVVANAPAAPGGLWRLSADWSPPAPPADVAWRGGVAEADGEKRAIEYQWVSETARMVGSVTHAFLQQIAEDGAGEWDAARLERARPALRARLAGEGVDPVELDGAEARTLAALQGTLDEPTGRWILAEHAEAENELALASWADDRPATHIIDRTFVAADGTRWIIDYKTGYREGGDIDGFLDLEVERHGEQLRRYRDLIRALDTRPVRLGLYFPLLGRFREVE